MTEKRFTMDYEPTYRDTMYLDGDDVMTENEVLNTLNRLNDENEQLKKKIKKILQKRYNQSKEDYERAVKAGMPSSISYDEMEIYEELAKEIGVDLE